MKQPPPMPMPPQTPMPPYGGPGMSPKQLLPKRIKYVYWGGAFTALLGVAILAIASWVYTFSGESASWQSTEGQIVSSRIRTKTSRGGRVTGAGRYSGSSIRYYPEMLYRYRVNGTFYQSTRFALARTAPDFREREEAVAYQQENFPKGQKVTVHYNPNDPSQAFLNATRDQRGWMAFAMGGGFLLMAVMVFAIGWSENKKHAARQAGSLAGGA